MLMRSSQLRRGLEKRERRLGESGGSQSCIWDCKYREQPRGIQYLWKQVPASRQDQLSVFE